MWAALVRCREAAARQSSRTVAPLAVGRERRSMVRGSGRRHCGRLQGRRIGAKAVFSWLFMHLHGLDAFGPGGSCLILTTTGTDPGEATAAAAGGDAGIPSASCAGTAPSRSLVFISPLARPEACHGPPLRSNLVVQGRRRPQPQRCARRARHAGVRQNKEHERFGVPPHYLHHTTLMVAVCRLR